MTQTLTSHKGPVQLHYDGGQVVVTPEDQDRFVLAARQAVSACQGAVVVDRMVNQFKTDFLSRLHAWCIEHRPSVRACYVPYPPSCGCAIKVFVVVKKSVFDLDLSDSVADLEASLDAAGWPCDILQIATGLPEELQAFFDPEQSIQVCDDGNGGPASAEG
jgi:hypothetical protein